MDKNEFIRRYRDRIRVRMDWYALGGDDWALRSVHLALPHDLDRLWTPWYPNAADSPPPSDPRAWPLSLREAAANRQRLGSNQDSLDRHMRAWRDGQTIELPALTLTRERYLLLDGNHRVAAGAMLQGAANLVLHALQGPAGARLLLDLPRFE